MSVISELFRHRSGPEVAFVLGGGGNLGAVQVGMLRALVERGIVPDVVVGCSVGALNGAGIAAGATTKTVDRMQELWESLDGDDIFPGRLYGPWQLFRRQEGLYENGGLRRVIERWLPYRTFEEAAIPVHVVATSLFTQLEHWFSSGPVVEPLLASTALPAVFPPVWVGDEPFIDGGVVNNVPVSKAFELRARTVYLLNPGNFDRHRAHPQRPLDVLIQAFSIARTHRHRVDLDKAPDGVQLIEIPSVDPGGLRYNDFSRSRELIALGHTTAARFLDSLEGTAAGQ